MTSLPQNIAYRNLYEQLEQYFLKWYLILVICVGTCGNAFCLVFIVFGRIFPFVVGIWMCSICVGDLLVLWLDAGRMFVKVWLGSDWDIRDVSPVLCQGHLFLSNFFLYWSGWNQAVFSFQRMYHLVRPLKARVYFTRHRVTAAWLCIGALLILPVSPYLWLWNVNRSSSSSASPGNAGNTTTTLRLHWIVDNKSVSDELRYDCAPLHSNYYVIITLFDLVFWCCLPTLTMIVCTHIIYMKLQHRKQQLLSDVRKQRDRQSKLLIPNITSLMANTMNISKRQLQTQVERSAVTSPSIKLKFLANFKYNYSFKKSKAALPSEISETGCADFAVSTPPPPVDKSTTLTGSTSYTTLSKAPAEFTLSATGQSPAVTAGRLKSVHINRLLIMMNIFYIVCSLPLQIYQLYLNFDIETGSMGSKVGTQIDAHLAKSIYYFMRSVCYLSSSFNWMLYLVAGKKFRSKVFAMFRVMRGMCCRCRNTSGEGSGCHRGRPGCDGGTWSTAQNPQLTVPTITMSEF